MINWKKVQQNGKRIFTLLLLQIAFLGGMLFNTNGVLAATDATAKIDTQTSVRRDSGEETRSIPEQAKDAIDNGLSVFKQATENSLEKLNPDDTTSAEGSKFYDPIEGREAMDREGGR